MTERKPHRNELLGLLQFQFQLIARFSERQAEVELQQEFGMRLLEARIIGMVGAFEAMPFKFLTAHGRFEKGHASRLVAGLVAKGLLASNADPEDQRATLLSLTAPGKRLYRGIAASAVRSNERWLAVLAADERAGLKRALATLLRASRGVPAGQGGKHSPMKAVSRTKAGHRSAR